MRSPIRAAHAAILFSALVLPGIAAAQAPANPPANPPPPSQSTPPSQQKPPEIPPARQESGQEGKLPVITPPRQIDPGMVKPAPDAGPNSTPVVKPPPNGADPTVPK